MRFSKTFSERATQRRCSWWLEARGHTYRLRIRGSCAACWSWLCRMLASPMGHACCGDREGGRGGQGPTWRVPLEPSTQDGHSGVAELVALQHATPVGGGGKFGVVECFHRLEEGTGTG